MSRLQRATWRRFERLEERCLLATIGPGSYSAGDDEVNDVKVSADGDWLTFKEENPHYLFYIPGAFNPEFLKDMKVNITGDENNHTTLISLEGVVEGLVEGAVSGVINCDGAVVVALGEGGPLACVGPIEADVTADVTADLTAEGVLYLDPASQPNPDLVDASYQVDIDFSLLTGLQRLPEADAIVPISAASVAILAVDIPAQVAAAYLLKVPLGAPVDSLGTIAIFTTLLTTLGIIGAAAASGDVTVDVGDKGDSVDLTGFSKNSNVTLGDGNDEILLGLGNDTVNGGSGTDSFKHTNGATGTTKTINGGDGKDILLINGFENSDVIELDFTSSTNFSLTINGQVNTYSLTNVEEIALSTGGGDDEVTIKNIEKFPGTLAIDVGDGYDSIEYESDVTTALLSDTPFDPGAGSPWPSGTFGVLSFDDVPSEFINVELLTISGSAETVEYIAPDDGDQVDISGGGTSTSIRMNANTTIVIANDATTLKLTGGAGDDTITIDPASGTSFTTIEIDGGEPAGNNQLVLNGGNLADTMTYSPGGNFRAGTVQFNAIEIDYLNIDGLQLNGNGGNNTLVAKGTSSNDFINFQPTINETGGNLVVTTPGINFSPINFANFGDRTIDGNGGNDVLAAASNNLPGANSNVCIVGGSTQTTVTWDCTSTSPTKFKHDSNRLDVLSLELNSSVDVVDVTPGSGVQIAANMWLGENTLIYHAAAGATVTLDLDTNTYSQSGYGDVTFTGSHTVIEANNNALTVSHTGNDDSVMTLQLSGANAGSFQTNDPFKATAEFSMATQLNLDGDGDLNLIGSDFADSFNVEQTVANEVDLTQRIRAAGGATVNYVPVHAEGYTQVSLFGGRNSDTFRVEVAQALATSSTNTLAFTFDGGVANDRLVVVDNGVGDTIQRREDVDELAGFVIVGTLEPVAYVAMETVQTFPFDPATGGTGNDRMGQEVIFESDPLEPNDNRLTAQDFDKLDGVHRAANISVPALDLFNDDVLGDEDWYRYDAATTGTYRIAVLFSLVGDPANMDKLPNGQPGLPGSGELDLLVYDAQGRLIVNADDLPTAALPGTSGDLDLMGNTVDPTVDADGNPLTGPQQGPTGKVVDVAIEEYSTIYVRVKGHTPAAINRYDVLVLDPQELATGPIPDLHHDDPTSPNADEVPDPPGGGLRVTQVEINSFNPADKLVPDSQAPTAGPRSPTLIFPPDTRVEPTFAVESITIHLEDFPARTAGFQYPAIHETIALQPGNYVLEGDFNGPITIDSITVENDPVVLGQIATGRVTLHFNYPLPDDRYSFRILDTLVDPGLRPLDGETNSLAPVPEDDFKSGNGVPGGDFVGNFSVDTRVEIGTFYAGSFWLDLNGNGVFDPENPNPTNRDVVYQFGTNDGLTDKPVIGDWNGDGFAEVGLYARDKSTGVYRFTLDRNANGLFDPGPSSTDDPLAFPFLANGTGSASPLAADWNNDGIDDVGLLNNFNWLLDLNGDRTLSAGETIPTNFEGLPFAGNWDGTTKTFPNGSTGPNMRVGTYNASQETFYFDMNGDRRFDESLGDLKVRFGVPGIERPLVGDFDADFDTNLGIMMTNVQQITPGLITQWLLDLGTPPKNPLLYLTRPTIYDMKGSPGDGKFQPAPTGYPGQPAVYQDIFYETGDARYLPFSGNFDLPSTRYTANPVPTPPPPPAPGANPFHNDPRPADVNNDGVTNLADATALNTWLIANGTKPTSAITFSGLYLDVNNDQIVSPQDLLVVQWTLAGGSPEDGFNLSSLSATATGMYTNFIQPEDVNLDGLVSAVDALIIANDINAHGNRPAAEIRYTGYFLDPSGDDRVSALDFLWVANWLSNRGGSGSGEGEGTSIEVRPVVSQSSSADGSRSPDRDPRPTAGLSVRAEWRPAVVAVARSGELAPTNLLLPPGLQPKAPVTQPTADFGDDEWDEMLSNIAADVGDHWQRADNETR